MFLAGFIEIPAYLLNIVLLQCLGRRLSMSGSTFLAGLALLITVGVPKGILIYSLLVSLFHKESKKSLIIFVALGLRGLFIALTLTSKFFISMAFMTAYQYAIELYPTYIRTLGLNCSNACARVGVLAASYMPVLVTVYRCILYLNLI